MRLISPAGRTVTGLADWPRPKKEYQWAPGRSAMEQARRWLSVGGPAMPPEIHTLLMSVEETRDLVIDDVIPEFVTSLPEAGEGRNHDILIRAHRRGFRITIGIEAKTDEPFDEYVGPRCLAAENRSPRTRVPMRTAKLLEHLFGRICDPQREPFCSLRYQLVMAAAACAAQAHRDRADRAVFVVHEIPTWKCKSAKLTQNHRDFAEFIALVFGGASADVTDGQLYGPILLSSVGYTRTPVLLYAGKASSAFVAEWRPNVISAGSPAESQ